MKHTKYRLNLETIRRLIRKDAVLNLQNLLKRLHAMDIAAMSGDLSPAETETVFRNLEDDDTRAMVLAGMDPEPALTVLESLDNTRLQKVLKAMPPDDAAALLDRLPEHRASDLQQALSAMDLDRVEDLLTYPEETAGRIMTPQVFALPGELTVKQAMEKVRDAFRAETVFYLYVVGEHKKLLGVVSLRQLLQEDPETPLKAIMQSDVITVTPDLDQEEVAHIVARYDLLAVPVVDQAGFLLGIVTVDDVIDIIHEEAREDIYRLAGSSLSEHDMTSPVRMAGVRMKWLLLRFAGALAGAALLLFFLSRLGVSGHLAWAAALLLVFISLLSGVGTQSSTIVAEHLTLRSDQIYGFGKMVATESLIGFVIGIVLSAVTGAILGLAGETPWIDAAKIAGALLAGMVIAAGVGTCLPYAFYKIHRDPSVVTGSLITAVLDVLSVGIFVGAMIWIKLSWT
ncbi:MAG TPA: magnesium transporter [bacterium]|nr:magnesium transporter [bacterium]